ncbi:MAG: hypothetical protein EOO89_20820 [Pedobacter sp.]|nr:MAG: hypothetical protein EOO89_20820 [Pedobacter sp.]
MKNSFSQSTHSGLQFGKYEGVEIKYLKHASDTSSKVDRMNERWGKKTLTIDSNGTFLLEFPVPYPTTTVEPNRLTTGRWFMRKDTLVLNSFHPYSDFIKVDERKVKDKRIRVKLSYAYKGEKYYPPLSVRINSQDEKMIDTKGKQWTYFPSDTVKKITIEHWVSPTSTNREWVYRPLNGNSNSFAITVTDTGERDNFVVEDYKLLIVGSSLMQIDQVFRLRENCFKATNFR